MCDGTLPFFCRFSVPEFEFEGEKELVLCGNVVSLYDISIFAIYIPLEIIKHNDI